MMVGDLHDSVYRLFQKAMENDIERFEQECLVSGEGAMMASDEAGVDSMTRDELIALREQINARIYDLERA